MWTVFLYFDVLLHFLLFNFSLICVVKFFSHVFLCLLSNSLVFSPRLLCLFSKILLHCYRNYSNSLVEMVQWFYFGILVTFMMPEKKHCHIISFFHFIVLMVSLWRPV